MLASLSISLKEALKTYTSRIPKSLYPKPQILNPKPLYLKLYTPSPEPYNPKPNPVPPRADAQPWGRFGWLRARQRRGPGHRRQIQAGCVLILAFWDICSFTSVFILYDCSSVSCCFLTGGLVESNHGMFCFGVKSCGVCVSVWVYWLYTGTPFRFRRM